MAANLTTYGMQSTACPSFEVMASHGNCPDGVLFATNNSFSNTVRWNQGSHFNTATGAFTAPVTGRYLFCATCRFDNVVAESYMHLGPNTSNVARTSMAITMSMNRTYESLTCVVITDMDASDTCYCQWYMSGGSTSSDLSGESTFSMCLLT